MTRLTFQGDPHHVTQQRVKASLIIDFQGQMVGKTTDQTRPFDIVLAPAKQ